MTSSYFKDYLVLFSDLKTKIYEETGQEGIVEIVLTEPAFQAVMKSINKDWMRMDCNEVTVLGIKIRKQVVQVIE